MPDAATHSELTHTPGLFDEVARERLRREISTVARSGVAINVGVAEDPAFREPDAVRAQFQHLTSLDQRLAEQARALQRGRHRAGLWGKRWARHLYRELDRHRIAWLYGPEAADCNPWHEQRGRATALLPVAAAFDLDDGSGNGPHQTMSGPLRDAVLGYAFTPDVPLIGGMGLAAAVAHARAAFEGRKVADAQRTAARRIAQLREFIETPTTSEFRQLVRFCTDGIGIRTRKALVAQRIHEALDDLDSLDAPLILSFGCGTALPILEVLVARREGGATVPTLILLDQDPLALAAAATLATTMGLEQHLEIHCQRLFDRFGRPTSLRRVLTGRRLDVVEDTGLREYLPDHIYRWLTRQTWDALKPGGLMSTGNMNAARPQAEFLHGMMGWQPEVQMRTIDRGLVLHAQAGIPTDCTSVTVTPDGVYSLFFSSRPRPDSPRGI